MGCMNGMECKANMTKCFVLMLKSIDNLSLPSNEFIVKTS
jgi:hypothetical protein